MALLKSSTRCLTLNQSFPGRYRLFSKSASRLQPSAGVNSAAKLLEIGQDVDYRLPNNLVNAHTRQDNRDRAQSFLERTQERDTRLQSQKSSAEYARQMRRTWIVGDVYAPHDLSPAEMRKEKRNRKGRDMIDFLQVNPLDLYKNPMFLADFMTTGGSILHSSLTNLRPVNQRKVAKAIRRAIGLGILPSVHPHPEILKHEFASGSNSRFRAVKNKTGR